MYKYIYCLFFSSKRTLLAEVFSCCYFYFSREMAGCVLSILSHSQRKENRHEYPLLLRSLMQQRMQVSLFHLSFINLFHLSFPVSLSSASRISNIWKQQWKKKKKFKDTSTKKHVTFGHLSTLPPLSLPLSLYFSYFKFLYLPISPLNDSLIHWHMDCNFFSFRYNLPVVD